MVDTFGSLQFDPLDVPGAKNHDLVLHARLAGYRRELLDGLLYAENGDDRRLFEAYNKSLNILPVSELPLHRIAWSPSDTPRSREILAQHEKLVAGIVERLGREGPLAADAFDRTEKVEDYWGTTTSLSRRLLDALFVTGRIGIHRRTGGRRFYHLMERLFSTAILSRKVDDEEAQLHRLLSRHRGVGLMGEGGSGELVIRTGKTADRKRRVATLIDRGLLVPVTVEGVKGTRHVLASERTHLDATKLGKKLRAKPTVTFLAPLDPLMWDRRLVRDLFGFDYVWEVYTPVEKRAFGYYVLPMLFGDRLVGRIEPRFDKKTKRLLFAAAWTEQGFDLDEAHFSSSFRAAVVAYAEHVGATDVRFGRGKIAAALAKTTR